MNPTPMDNSFMIGNLQQQNKEMFHVLKRYIAEVETMKNGMVELQQTLNRKLNEEASLRLDLAHANRNIENLQQIVKDSVASLNQITLRIP
tara:strand:- start:1310 stop:1582 length:273 start_codon:yes stop_codon:yes gene_type:complete